MSYVNFGRTKTKSQALADTNVNKIHFPTDGNSIVLAGKEYGLTYEEINIVSSTISYENLNKDYKINDDSLWKKCNDIWTKGAIPIIKADLSIDDISISIPLYKQNVTFVGSELHGNNSFLPVQISIKGNDKNSISRIYVKSVRDIESIKSIKYSYLKDLVDNGKLTEGQWYRINDYVTTIDSNAFNDIRSAEDRFDIIVQAIQYNQLSETAYAIQNDANPGKFRTYNLSAWKLKYTIYNDIFTPSDKVLYSSDGYSFRYVKPIEDINGTTYYLWVCDEAVIEDFGYTYATTHSLAPDPNTDIYGYDFEYFDDEVIATVSEVVDSTPGKGTILWMQDEFGNEAPYDFKNIQFKLYSYNKNGEFHHRGFETQAIPGYTMDGSSYLWTYSFCDYSVLMNRFYSDIEDKSLAHCKIGKIKYDIKNRGILYNAIFVDKPNDGEIILEYCTDCIVRGNCITAVNCRNSIYTGDFSKIEDCYGIFILDGKYTNLKDCDFVYANMLYNSNMQNVESITFVNAFYININGSNNITFNTDYIENITIYPNNKNITITANSNTSDNHRLKNVIFLPDYHTTSTNTSITIPMNLITRLYGPGISSCVLLDNLNKLTDNLVTSNNNLTINVVDEMPANPIANTLYIVKAS